MRKLFAAVALTGALVTIGSSARADDSEPLMKRYPPTSVRWKIVATGAVVVGAAWGVSYLTSTQWPDVPGANQMKIPVIGPWIALGHAGCSPSNTDCGALLYVRGVLQVIDGLVQAGGVGLIGEGLFMTTESEEASPKKKAAHMTWRPMPIVTPHTTGLGFVGTF